MIGAVSCPHCGTQPTVNVDDAGLRAHAFVVWCENCDKHQRFRARGLTRARAVELWNDRVTRVVQS